MELRKWVSNNEQVIKSFCEYTTMIQNVHFGNKDQHKTLGLFWAYKEDTLMFIIHFGSHTNSTKRSNLDNSFKYLIN